MGYADHEKAYRFEEIKSGRVLVSRDAQFMEDVFDSGRRNYVQLEVVLENEEGSTDEDSSCSNKEEEENVQDQDVEPGSKRHQRTRSLEEAADILRANDQVGVKGW